ncbi:conserved hypothetical protein [Histoplasma capsulatum var. duboisii H88]|uniref:Uncharacterized protein n=1 Tax=Ajellomyces capsulatus (strain H88) TaxID=544711 RepID=F0UHA2_AJEC8|nr:conserved hypothetical protein [Histoplasma capsulatum var. duboisii H88]QSS55221.1 hypothetical protein I7I53_03048 [Histoplasma capsulatum var. duboisii H88]
MVTTFNGLGALTLPQVINALRRLQDNPELLARERSAFSDPPPPYASRETTQPPSPPRPLTEADRRRERQRRKEERLNSMPERQFAYQRRIEEERLIDQSMRRKTRRKDTLPFNKDLTFATNAVDNVTNRWKEQGIWNDKWKAQPLGPRRWSHEEPPEPDLEPELEKHPHRSGPDTLDPPKPWRKIVNAESMAAQVSRPYYQFLFQKSKEREWLEDELDIEPSDIDTKAYENVKNRWLAQKIWNLKWGHMPGLTWIHEDPDDDDDDEDDSENLGNPPAGESVSHNPVESDSQPVRRVRYKYRSDTFGSVEVTSPSPEPTGEAGPSLTSRTMEGSNGDALIDANAFNLLSPVPQSPKNTEEPQEPSRLALYSKGKSKKRKGATQTPPDPPDSTSFQLRKRLPSTFGLTSTPQSPVLNTTGNLPAEDEVAEPSPSTLPSRNANPDSGSREHQQQPLRNSSITNKSSVSWDTSVDTNKISVKLKAEQASELRNTYHFA